ncbi:FRG domain-containing protein [Halorussus limi]|uniref:FRG domain-containing protein n=1 Tax=Halorussus limi TaxID=2938695 RepID=A0A8U0HV37_9EURY|nr:FRG domain-containing protein [Halorussus limi]UPV74965.1 FRG domain-containing protein [Halorussus limi]
MNEIRVRSWEHLQSLLFEDEQNEDLGRYRSPYVFRGQSDVEYDLRTSLIRLIEEQDEDADTPPVEKYENIESHLLRNFSKYAYQDVPTQSVWHLLSVAQHHGLPTRLLDWTFSPLVAAHFTTENTEKFDSEGVIWRVNQRKAHEQLPDVLSHVLKEEQSSIFTVDMLDGAVPSIVEEKERVRDIRREMEPEIRKSKSMEEKRREWEKQFTVDPESISFPSVQDSLREFDELGHFALFFEPPSLDERIINQSALFSVMPSPNAKLDEWLEDNPGVGDKIIIPADLKPQIRDYLDQANITERVLFPGLDGLADWLKRYYTPKHKWESLTPDE